MNIKKIYKIIMVELCIVCGLYANQSPLEAYQGYVIYNEDTMPKAELPAGTIDTTFNPGFGYTVLNYVSGTTGSNFSNAVVIDSLNRITFGGSIPTGFNQQFVLGRLLYNGTLDTSFGTNGYVTTMPLGQTSFINTMMLDNDDKIIVGGSVNGKFYILRYLSDGIVDDNFLGGKLFQSIGSNCEALSFDSQHRIIAGGVYISSALVARYDADGVLDVDNFSVDGYFTYSVGPNDVIYSVTTDPSDNIIATGGSGLNIFVMKILENGSGLDTSFGTNGVVTITPFGPTGDSSSAVGYSITLDANQNIIVGAESRGNFALIRLTPTGALDTTFGGSGKIAYTLGNLVNNSSGGCVKVVIDPLGRIVMFGSQEDPVSEDGIFVVARVNPDGSLDKTFGGGTGFASTSLVTGKLPYDVFEGLIDDNGRLLLVGSGNNSNQFALARFTTDYTLPYYQQQFRTQSLGFL